MTGYVHIYAPPCLEKSILSGTCPDCKKRTRFTCYFYEWHGPEGTCLRCGRSYADDELLPLPFERGSRQKEIARAKERWRRTKALGYDHLWPEEAP